ncbi:putative 6,7-dimethyl-8-ribityllumazine synthase [Candidatus Tremblaya phenacola PAVE]|nr:putative 6,7-dimethyl-8-ribityllumazine synthase [Candidatus Tremblaya phenacola PAVE]
MLLLIQTRFYSGLSLKMVKTCFLVLHSFGVEPHNITLISVSGSLEAAMLVGRVSANYSAILIMGIVLRGLTSHSELVTNISFERITELQLGGVIINGSLLLTSLSQLLNKVKYQSQYVVAALLEASNALRLG